MINFRFHLASLIAIFLALALGVVIGAGVIDRGVVDTLNSRLDSVERNADRTQRENDLLRGDSRELTEAIRELACHTVEDRMLGDGVAVLAVRGVDGRAVEETVDAVRCAGANVQGVLWLEPRWRLAKDDGHVMATILDAPGRRPAVLRTTAWRQLAQRLESPPLGDEGASDLLVALQDAGFVQFQPLPDQEVALAQFPARGSSLLLVVGTNGGVPSAEVVGPAAAALVAVGFRVVVADVHAAGDDAPPRGSAFAELRDGPLGRAVSTVDNLDRPHGPATAVLALAALEQVPPVVDHYGQTGGKLLPDTIRR